MPESHSQEANFPNTRSIEVKSKKGFTLTELVVSIAILAILAMILVPVIRSAREKAVLAKCTTNLRQVGAALKLYANDHDGQYPDRTYDGHLQKIAWRDIEELNEYVGGTKEVFYCPGAINNGYGPDVSPSGYKNWRENGTINLGYVVLWNRPPDIDPENPAMWDRATGDSIHSPPYAILAADMIYTPPGQAPLLTNHTDSGGMPTGGNVLVNDGSVRWVPFDPNHFIQYKSSPFLIPDKERRD